MRNALSTRRNGLSIAIALALIVGAFRAHGTDIYNPVLNQLTIPLVRIGHITYSNVVLTVGSIVGTPNGVAGNNWDIYDPASGQLTISEVNVGNSVYYGPVITVAQLLSIGGASSADTFDGKNLTVPYAQVGSSIFYNVMLSISAADVVSVNGGMPHTSIDQYDAANGQLAIGAVQVGSRFFTNVTVSVMAANIVSVGGDETVLYTFQGKSDGANPQAGLAIDASGNLFGTTFFGGAYELSADGSSAYSFSVLPTIGGSVGGTDSQGSLILDANGNLYGTTLDSAGVGYGTVYKLAPGSGGYTQSVLYTFTNGADGAYPESTLVMDAHGNLYGTSSGGSNSGTVFELSPNGSGGYDFSVLYTFQGTDDGANPQAGLLMDKSGSLYGTATAAGSGNSGTVFELRPNGSGGYDFTLLYAFQGGADGAGPVGGLAMDAGGNLFGTASLGGIGFGEFGTVFKLTPNGSGGFDFSVVHAFQGGADGAVPIGNLIVDGSGNLYGTTSLDGLGSLYSYSYFGTIFKLAPDGNGGYSESVLYNFLGGDDGANPQAGLIMDAGGKLYGTAMNAGANSDGVVFSLK